MLDIILDWLKEHDYENAEDLLEKGHLDLSGFCIKYCGKQIVDEKEKGNDYIADWESLEYGKYNEEYEVWVCEECLETFKNGGFENEEIWSLRRDNRRYEAIGNRVAREYKKRYDVEDLLIYEDKDSDFALSEFVQATIENKLRDIDHSLELITTEQIVEAMEETKKDWKK